MWPDGLLIALAHLLSVLCKMVSSRWCVAVRENGDITSAESFIAKREMFVFQERSNNRNVARCVLRYPYLQTISFVGFPAAGWVTTRGGTHQRCAAYE